MRSEHEASAYRTENLVADIDQATSVLRQNCSPKTQSEAATTDPAIRRVIVQGSRAFLKENTKPL